jgi:hypothetical protein
METTTQQQENEKAQQRGMEYILPANLTGDPEEILTPSGRFRLLIRQYNTKPGCWGYSRGTVTRVSDGQEVCDIVRNYSFTHSFVNKGGQEWLITGRSYMSQTIVNLDTGEEFEPNEDHYDGHAFCWVSAKLSPDESMLVVEGCHWACPYEFRFYDFKDPSQGWKQFPILPLAEYEAHKDSLEEADDTYLSADDKPIEFNEDGAISVFKSEGRYLPTGQRESSFSLEQLKECAGYDDESNWDRIVDVKHVLERRGDVIVILDTWKSDHELERERRNQEWEKKREKDFAHWKATDVFLAKLRERLQQDPDLVLGTEGWVSSSGHDRENGDLNFWYFRPEVNSKRPQDPRKTAEIKWGTLAGDTLAVRLWTYAADSTNPTFPKTEDGLNSAIEAIRAHYASPTSGLKAGGEERPPAC